MTDEEALADVRGVLTQARDSLDGVHMQRPAAALVATARVRRRRRWLSGSTAACAVLGVALLVTGVLPLGGRSAGRAGGGAQARTVAYVVGRVERALASQDFVLYGRMSGVWGDTVSWSYGRRGQFQEFWPARDYRDRVVHGRHLWDFPPRDRGKLYLVDGTALVRGKLKEAYVTYFDRRYSLSRLTAPPVSACSKTVALSMGSPPIPGVRWAAFVKATLDCGAASVTGHVRIDGMETTKITGKPVTVRLSRGYGKTVGEKWVRARWILYVNPKTYLPVRAYSSLDSFGGPRHASTTHSVIDVTWLPPTPANLAKTLVHIPRGFHQWGGNPGNQ